MGVGKGGFFFGRGVGHPSGMYAEIGAASMCVDDPSMPRFGPLSPSSVSSCFFLPRCLFVPVALFVSSCPLSLFLPILAPSCASLVLFLQKAEAKYDGNI